MKRGNNFWRRNQYKIAAVCLCAAAAGILGVYLLTANSKSQPKQQVAQEEVQKKSGKVDAADNKKTEEETEQTQKASAVIRPKQNGTKTDSTNAQTKESEQTQNDGTDTAQLADREDNALQAQTDMAETADPAEETAETAAAIKPASKLHFNAEAGLLWPVSGSVILDYSMDQTIYFTTLDQYKYNPAVIISGNVNDKVQAAADGKITDISTNEVTGCTVTMDIGDGYTAIYGQLKEVPYETGAFIEAGNTIGFVSEPTKYYSLEGSNLYFELKKDDVPVNPIEFFQ